MIRVLLVEDDAAVVELVRYWLSDCSPTCELIVASNRDDGLGYLTADLDFDLVICDLKIPPRAGSADSREEHGMDVHYAMRASHPGTPCLFFTGHADDIDISGALSSGGTDDVFGTGEFIPLVSLVKKLYAESAGDYIAQVAAAISGLDGITLDLAGLELTPFEQRTLRIFAMRHKGVTARLVPTGGLSGAKSCEVIVTDDEKTRRARAFAKIAPRDEVADEERRFVQFVSVHLDPRYVPVVAGHVISGAGRSAALFYSLASQFDRSLFDVLSQDEAAAVAIVKRLKHATEPWMEARAPDEMQVGDLRRLWAPDDRITDYEPELAELDRGSVENVSVRFRRGPQHGDLHGKNALVDGDGQVLLIDFGDVERHPSGIDPITLELSALFHPDRPEASSPSVEACLIWHDLDAFAGETAFPDFVRACRMWARELTESDPTLLALAYAHALRQLKYPTTDKALALAIAKSVAIELLGP